MVTITLQLPDTLERKAREIGLLTDESVAALIEAELERQRQEAWAAFERTSDALQASFRADYPNLSEDEALALMEQWIDEAEQPKSQSST